MLSPTQVADLLRAVRTRAQDREYQRARRARMGPEARREEWLRYQRAARSVAVRPCLLCGTDLPRSVDTVCAACLPTVPM